MDVLLAAGPDDYAAVTRRAAIGRDTLAGLTRGLVANRVYFIAFDLLAVGDHDVRGSPLVSRRAQLEEGPDRRCG